MVVVDGMVGEGVEESAGRWGVGGVAFGCLFPMLASGTGRGGAGAGDGRGRRRKLRTTVAWRSA